MNLSCIGILTFDICLIFALCLRMSFTCLSVETLKLRHQPKKYDFNYVSPGKHTYIIIQGTYFLTK